LQFIGISNFLCTKGERVLRPYPHYYICKTPQAVDYQKTGGMSL